MRTTRAPAFQRARAERRRAGRGQALLEFALLFPLLLLLVVGATDVSTLLDDHLALVNAARSGARVGSVLGKAPSADCAIVGAVRAALSASPNLTVTRIVIYQASNTGAPQGANEDVFAGSAVCLPDTSVSPPASQLGWPPSMRNDTPVFEDSIGVEIDFSYTFTLNLLGIGQFSAEDHAVMPIDVVIGSPLPPSGIGT